MSMYGKHPKKWNAEKMRWDDPPTTDCSKDPSLTSQSFRDDADINVIVKRIEKSGFMPVINDEPFYGDISSFDGLADAIQKVQNMEEFFMSYPAHIREKFSNDPLEFLNFVSNDQNRQAAIDMGLINKPPVQEAPVPVENIAAKPEVKPQV